ncbi:MAG: rhodanese-like domain-containing protein [Gammaproteobacteria bacterium]
MAIPELSPRAFIDRWPQKEVGQKVILLDVREAAELELASLPTANHIPMNQVPQRLDELDVNKPIVVMCHSGVRSYRVAEFLVTRGFKKVFNLSGGIDAWSKQLDPKVPQY